MRLLPLTCLIAAAIACEAQTTVTLDNGAGERRNCPVAIALKADSPLVKDAAGGKAVVLTADGKKVAGAVLPSADGYELAFVLAALPAGKTVYEVAVGEVPVANTVELLADSDLIRVSMGGRPLTTYDPRVKPTERIWPVLHPLNGPGGVMLTRAFPLDGDPAETKDHPHHQSVWTAHGDVNGINFWHLKEGHGLVKQRACHKSGAPAVGRISATLDWCDASGTKVLEECRTITFWGTPDTARIIDFDAVFRATETDVKFGDTKEGGLLGVRLADSMREKQKGDAPKGKVSTSEGAADAKAAWGKPASWCDYSGPVGQITAGVALLAHPKNIHHPMRWHVRDYGLMTANPFGLSDFMGKGNDGSRTLKRGESWRMRFRLIAHAGGAEEARLTDAYRDYSEPPAAFVK